MNKKTTKTAAGSRPKRVTRDELAREFRFDYGKSRASRFAGRVPRDASVVILDADVAKVFDDPKQINALLRATIHAVQKRRPRRAG